MTQPEENGVFRAIVVLGCIGLAMWIVVIAALWNWIGG